MDNDNMKDMEPANNNKDEIKGQKSNKIENEKKEEKEDIKEEEKKEEIELLLKKRVFRKRK